jgi:hypothetical protein
MNLFNILVKYAKNALKCDCREFSTTNVFPPLHSVVLLVISTFLKMKRQDINYGHLCISWNRNFIQVMFVCLRIVVSNTYCVLFLLCFSSSCGPYVASFSGLSFLPLTYFFNYYII